MFQFPRLPLSCLYIQQEVPRNDSWWVYPFGNPRVTGYVLLTVAYRAYHVLHRLLVPRHPPFALTIFFSMV